MTKNIFSDESLRDWLETQDPSGEYDYERPRCCMLSRYFKAVMPLEEVYVTATAVETFNSKLGRRRAPLPPHWNSIAKREPWTVGHVLDRLEHQYQ